MTNEEDRTLRFQRIKTQRTADQANDRQIALFSAVRRIHEVYDTAAEAALQAPVNGPFHEVGRMLSHAQDILAQVYIDISIEAALDDVTNVYISTQLQLCCELLDTIGRDTNEDQVRRVLTECSALVTKVTAAKNVPLPPGRLEPIDDPDTYIAIARLAIIAGRRDLKPGDDAETFAINQRLYRTGLTTAEIDAAVRDFRDGQMPSRYIVQS